MNKNIRRTVVFYSAWMVIIYAPAAVGDGVAEKATVTVSSSGSYATFKKSNLLGAGKDGYLYLKYEGEIDPSKLPVLIRLYTSGGEARVYTVFCDSSAQNAETGEPIFPEPEVTTPETTQDETTSVETTSEATAEATEPSESKDEGKPSSILPIVIAATAIVAIGAGAFIILKTKKRSK